MKTKIAVFAALAFCLLIAGAALVVNQVSAANDLENIADDENTITDVFWDEAGATSAEDGPGFNPNDENTITDIFEDGVGAEPDAGQGAEEYLEEDDPGLYLSLDPDFYPYYDPDLYPIDETDPLNILWEVGAAPAAYMALNSNIVENDPGFNPSTDTTMTAIPWEKRAHTGNDDAFTRARAHFPNDPSHIQLDGNAAYFYGYFTGPFSDYLYYEESDPSEKTFSFSMCFYIYPANGSNVKQAQRWHSIRSVGFLVNCVKNSDNTISGYYFSFENRNSRDEIVIRLLDHIDMNSLYSNSTPILSTPVLSSTALGNSTLTYVYEIKSSNKAFTVRKDGNVIFSLDLETANASSIPKGYTGGNDFGFYAGYMGRDDYHECRELSSAEFTNIKIQTKTVTPQSTLNVHFVDYRTRNNATPTEISATHIATGYVGQGYTVLPPSIISGYTYVSANASLTAKYTANPSDIILYYQKNCTVTYHANFPGGQGTGTAPVDVNSPYGVNETVTVLDGDMLAKPGWEFVGWNTEQNGKGAFYEPGKTFTITDETNLYGVWQDYCKITYHANFPGGQGSGTAPVDPKSPYKAKATVIVLGGGALAKPGWEFLGWNTAQNGQGTFYPAGKYLIVIGDMDFYGVWQEYCTVTYHANFPGGQGTGAAPVDGSSPYKANDTVTVLGGGTLAKPGWVLTGWSTAQNGQGAFYAAGNIFTITSDTNLYGVWQEYCTITYHANFPGGQGTGQAPVDGSSPYKANATVTVLGGGTLAKPRWEFVGWNTAQNGQGTFYAAGSSFTITSDVALYGVWQEYCTVTYHANFPDGQGTGLAPTDASSPYKANATITVLGGGTLAKTGWVLTGWNTAQNGQGAFYEAGNTFTITSDINLYGVWQEYCTVTYHANFPGGQGTGAAPVDAASPYKAKATVTVLGGDTLAKPRWEFIGWNTAQNGQGTFYAAGSSFAITSNTNLYGVWQEYCTVTYYANFPDGIETGPAPPDTDGPDGEGTDQEAEDTSSAGTGAAPTDAKSPYKANATVTVLDGGTLAKPRWVLTGWNTEPNGQGAFYAAGDIFTITADTVLYGVWQEYCTVTYHANFPGGTGTETGAETDAGTNPAPEETTGPSGAGTGLAPTDANSPYKANATVTVLDGGTLAKPRWVLTGWNTKPNGQGAFYAAGDIFTITADTVLYGVWQEYCTVIYHANFPESPGTGLAPVDAKSPYKANAEVTVLGNGTLEKSGWAFLGWNTEQNGQGVLYDAGKTFTITSDTNLYGAWNKLPTPSVSPPEIKVVVIPVTSPFIDDHVAYIIGYPDGYVRPERNVSRAEVATVFFRLQTDELRTNNWTMENPFPDVIKALWYNNAISVMCKMGILAGYPDGTFRPNNAITRAELAAIAARFARKMEMLARNDLSFSDIEGHWAESDINYAAAIGWVNGYPEGTFKPNQNITRAEFMTLVNRMLERVPESLDDLLVDEMETWSDNMDTNAWYYLAVQEATNSHTCTFKEGKMPPGLNFEYESWEEMAENRDWSQLEKGLLTNEQVKAQLPTPVNMAISTWQPEKQPQSRYTSQAFSSVSSSYWAYRYEGLAKYVLSQ